MATIAENLLALQQTKENFKTSFESKGVDLTNVPFTEYPNKLEDLKENLDTELTEQETALEELESAVNVLSDKPTDMLQQMVDATNSCNNLFYEYLGVNLDFISGLDTSNATNMNSMFANCRKLVSLDLRSFNTRKVTSMQHMFSNCHDLKTLDLSSFDTSSLTHIMSMFNNCYDLENLNISNFNTSNVESFSNLFYSCKALTNLNLSSFETSKLTSMLSMFSKCSALTELDLSNFNTSNVTDMGSAFDGCSELALLDLSSFDTRKVSSMSNMFSDCSKLTSISNIDMIRNKYTSNMFKNCTNLTNLQLKNIKKSLTIGSGTSYGHLLTNESLINTIQQLWDLTGTTSQTLTMSTTSKENIANIYVKLVDVTDEMLAQDEYAGNKKPCVVCESTDAGAMTLTEYATSKNWAMA